MSSPKVPLTREQLKNIGKKHPETSAPAISQLRQQIAENTVIATENVNQLLDRDVSLRELEEGTENLAMKTDVFQKEARQVERKKWWGSRMWIIYILIVIFLGFFMFVAYLVYKASTNSPQ